MVEALDGYLAAKSKRLFKAMKVFNEKELEARTEVRWDNYAKKIQIESRVIADIAIGQIVPMAIKYVITSYSIHYTKLYDLKSRQWLWPTEGSMRYWWKPWAIRNNFV